MSNVEAAFGYLVGGTADAFTAIASVFNGLICGFIAWLIFSLAMMDKKKDKPQKRAASCKR